MTIKRKIIFCSLLFVGVYVYAMDLFKRAWEKHQEERRELFEKLGQPMPEQTYEEAMKMHLKNTVDNDLEMRKQMAQQRDNQKNKDVKK